MPPEEVLAYYARGPFGYALAAVLGALFGSFANVCIYRLPPSEEHPKGRSVVTPASHCQACGATIKWYDNLPLVSYLWLRGKCRRCGAVFSARYLLVEAATAMLFVALYFLVFHQVYLDEALPVQAGRFAIYAAFTLALVVITFIDLDHKLILDKITYPAIPLFYLLGLLLPERGWYDGLIGAAVGYGVIRLVSDGYYMLTGREGLGYGDGKLLAVVGALLGWQGVVISLFLGSLIGSLISIVLVVLIGKRAVSNIGESGAAEVLARDEGGDEPDDGEPADEAAGEGEPALRHVAVPFGPFLAAGAVAYLFVETWLRISLRPLW